MTEAAFSTGNSFGKQNRLRGRSDFLKVIRGSNSSKLRGEYCRLSFARSDSEQTSFGISVSKRAGNSVKRNRIKRVIREYLRVNKSRWPSGMMVIINIDRECSDETELTREIETMLGKIE